MTLLYLDGFDAQDITRKWSNNLSTAPAYSTGRYGYGSAVKAGGSGRPIRGLTPSAQVIVGYAFKIQTLTTSKALGAIGTDSGATCHMYWEITSSGALRVTRSGTTLGITAAGVVTQEVWYYLEHRMTIHDSTGISETRLNGVQMFNFTGDTKNGGTSTNIDAFTLGNDTGNGHMDPAVWFDDLYVLNTLGSVNNTFLGETVVRTLMPTGAGASTALTPTGTANNWENVDEIGLSEADYNASGTSGARDTYALANLPVTPTAIYGVQTVVTGSKTDAAATSLKPILRSGSNYAEAPLALSITPTTTAVTRENDPATSALWLPAAVNALEVGAEVV
jgi:hypothetical protein